MNIGFTGTQKGLSLAQAETLDRVLLIIKDKIDSAHHGDCVGADKLFHDLITAYGLNEKIVIHPPKNHKARAFCESPNIREGKDYMVRNQDIVNESEVVLATPIADEKSLPRSGTWATIRRSKNKGNTTIVIYPDGNTVVYGELEMRNDLVSALYD